MTSPFRHQQVLEALADHPNGVTAKELAPKVGMTALRASQVLGHLFFASKITREKIREDRTEYVYRLKPEAPSLAPQAAPQSLGRPRIAGRETERV